MARWIGFDDDESLPSSGVPPKASAASVGAAMPARPGAAPPSAPAAAAAPSAAAAPAAAPAGAAAADGLLDFLSGRSAHLHVHHDDPPKPMRLSPTKQKAHNDHHRSKHKHSAHGRRASLTDIKSLEAHLDQWHKDLGEHPHDPVHAVSAAKRAAESPRIRHETRLYDWPNDAPHADQMDDDQATPRSGHVPLDREDPDLKQVRKGFAGGDAPASTLPQQPAPTAAAAAPQKSDSEASTPKPSHRRRHSVSNTTEQFMTVDALPFLQAGAVFVKHGRHGKPHLRRFWLEKNQLIRWYSPVKDTWECEIPVQNIDRILLGKQTDVFRRERGKWSRDIDSERCLSLVYHGTGTGNHTLDLVAESRTQREIWSLGLLFLARAARKGTNPEHLLEVPVEIHKDPTLEKSLKKKTYHFAPLEVPAEFKLVTPKAGPEQQESGEEA